MKQARLDTLQPSSPMTWLASKLAGRVCCLPKLALDFSYNINILAGSYMLWCAHYIYKNSYYQTITSVEH
jgi:hypothetical protein